jgi:hypothetical protein
VKADSGTPKIFNYNLSKSASKILRFYVDFIAIGAASARREASPLGERIALIYQEKE